MEKLSNGSLVKSVQKGLTILKYVMYAEREVSIQEIQLEFGFNTSTIHHQLKTLVEEGFISQNRNTRKYSIGSELFFYSLFHKESDTYLERIDPLLKECVTLTNETTNLFVQKGHEVICIRGYESSQYLKANLKIGRRLPLADTAAGRVFLVFTDSDENPEYEKIKKQGYCVEQDEFDDMITAIAVPVYDHLNEVKFSLCTVLPTARVKPDLFEKIAKIMVYQSSRITSVL